MRETFKNFSKKLAPSVFAAATTLAAAGAANAADLTSRVSDSGTAACSITITYNESGDITSVSAECHFTSNGI